MTKTINVKDRNGNDVMIFAISKTEYAYTSINRFRPRSWSPLDQPMFIKQHTNAIKSLCDEFEQKTFKLTSKQ